MSEDTAWGRPLGRAVYDELVSFVEARPDQQVFRLSMEGVKLVDSSFASEAIVELVKRYRSSKGICLVDLENADIEFNIGLAASNGNVPVLVWRDGVGKVIGGQPSPGNREAFEFALGHRQARAAEYAEKANVSIANASTKFKQLWEQGFLMRDEGAADSGGVEFVYQRIG